MEPIITSLLDNDAYNFGMGQTFWKMGLQNLIVEYELRIRSKINLAAMVNQTELSENLNHLSDLRLGLNELIFLSKYYDIGYLEYLLESSNKDNRIGINWEEWGHSLVVHYRGPVGRTILYETPVLSTINNLYAKSVKELLQYNDKNLVVDNAVNSILEISSCDAKWIEMGSRRRSSLDEQRTILKYALEEARSTSGCLGTSNILLARETNTKPMGTIGHQWFMIYAALEHAKLLKEKVSFVKKIKEVKARMLESQKQAIRDWTTHNKDSVLVTDTYGTDIFLKEILTPDMTSDILGLRQDSGDAQIRVTQLINYIKQNKLNLSITASDGLTSNTIKILKGLADANKVKINFGWGTNLTFNGIVKPISIVIKPKSIFIDGHDIPCVKLSDNINKAIGMYDVIDLYKNIFDYKENEGQEVVY